MKKIVLVVSVTKPSNLSYKAPACLPPPASTPDPMVNPKGKFVSLTIPPMKCTKIQDMGIMVQKGLVAGTINITGFGTLPVPFGITTPLTLTQSMSLIPYETQLHSAKQIINWIKSWVVPTPLGTSHGAYIGSGMHIATK
jgi:hypothetical protein